jgi:predicted DNA-binding transcriptional regulator AlpA
MPPDKPIQTDCAADTAFHKRHPDLSVTVTTEPLLDLDAVCAYFGGSRPLHQSTLYRGIRKGRYPAPIKVGGSSRWLWNECEAALARMVEARQ